MDLPSTPALIVPVAVDAALAWLDRALRGRRLVRSDSPLPSGYPARQDEWLGFVAAPLGSAATVLLISDIDAVFRIALWLTGADPDRDVLAWRRYRGLPPTLKLYLGKEPRWKDGEDDDHEVMWNVRAFDSEVDAARLRELGLPGRAGEVTALVGPTLRPYSQAITAPRPGEVKASWVAASSPLAP